MSRLALLAPETVEGEAKALLDRTKAQLGRLPNLYRAMANSPAALDGYLSFRGALVRGRLNTAMVERLALLVAEENGCDYCVAAHTFRGGKVGLSETDLSATRAGQSADAKTAAALRFALEVMRKRGAVSDAELEAPRLAGWTDEELTEMVGHVALNVFSNYFNHVAKPELDFPRAAPSFQRVVTSRHGFDETLAALTAAISKEELWLVAEIDPQKLLAREGHSISPARQLQFFHPRFMVRLLAAEPSAIVEAPLRVLVTEASSGAVTVRTGDVAGQLARYRSEALSQLGLELSDVVARVMMSVG